MLSHALGTWHSMHSVRVIPAACPYARPAQAWPDDEVYCYTGLGSADAPVMSHVTAWPESWARKSWHSSQAAPLDWASRQSCRTSGSPQDPTCARGGLEILRPAALPASAHQGVRVCPTIARAYITAYSMRRWSVFSSQGTFLLRACIGHTHETRSNSTALLHNLPRKK